MLPSLKACRMLPRTVPMDAQQLNVKWLQPQTAYCIHERDFRDHSERSSRCMQECTHSPNNMSLPEGCQIMVDKGSINLSRGQKQRLAIARASTGGSIILLLNERSSALDGVNERLSQERQVAGD